MCKYPSNVELENVNCPNKCESDDTYVLSGHDRLHNIVGEFTIMRCNKCGLERTTPRPTPETMGTYYPSSYAPYQASDTFVKTKDSSFKVWLKKVLGFNERFLPSCPPGRMLEVGCSSGAYMEMAVALGWDVEGIEFSDEAASIARKKGLKVKTGSLEKFIVPEKKYDIICAWMVLEHLHDPVAALVKLKESVSHSGYLVASVPDTKSLSKRLFQNYSYDLHLPNHLFHYSPRTLNSILETSGWKLERVFWQRNCNTLLNSFEYWAEDKNKSRLLKFAHWLRTSKRAGKIRVILSLMLGITRQSGRIEIWARPK